LPQFTVIVDVPDRKSRIIHRFALNRRFKRTYTASIHLMSSLSPMQPERLRRFVSVEFSPSSGCLGSIVSMVTDFCRNVVDEPQTRFAFQLAAYELTENLVKYATGEKTRVSISIEGSVRGPVLVLTTVNDSTPERLEDVRKRLEAAETATDPIQHFDQLIQESIATPGESRLGLGRLRAEGELLVSHSIQGRTLTIQVSKTVRRREEVTRS